jgi:hypothetical protein
LLSTSSSWFATPSAPPSFDTFLLALPAVTAAPEQAIPLPIFHHLVNINHFSKDHISINTWSFPPILASLAPPFKTYSR